MIKHLMFLFLIYSCSVFANENTTTKGVILEQTQKIKTTIPDMPFSVGRDPFSRVLDDMGITADAYNAQSYPLKEFVLIASVWGISNPIAVFLGPKGERYSLKKGDHIGKNDGVVKEIVDGQVEIVETYSGVQRPVIMKIKKQ